MKIFLSKTEPSIKRIKDFLIFSEWSFTVIYLILYASGILALFLTNGANENDGSDMQDFDFSLNRNLFFLNYVITFFLLAIRWKKTLYALRSNLLIWLLVILVPISSIWSYDSGKTLTASIAMIGTCLFGVYLASHYSPKQQLQLLGWAFGISAVLSVLFAIALPKYGIMSGLHAGAIRGIYTHKNGLGKMMVLGAGVFFILANDAKKYRVFLWSIFSLSFALILLSRSSGALVNILILLMILSASRALWLHTKLLVPLVISTIAIGIIGALGVNALIEIVFVSLGKSTTISGRTDLWPYLIDKIRERPLLGYGFGVFWNGMEGESAYIWKATRWKVPDAHNGFLDLLIDLGFVGLSVYLLSYWQTLVRSVIWIRSDRTWIGLWPLFLLVYLVLSNIAETTLFARNSLIWVMYTALVLTISMELKSRKQTFQREHEQIYQVY